MNWYHQIKTAIRGNLERMNDPHTYPYQHAKPGEISDGQLSYLTQYGDESGSSGSASIGGRRFRNKKAPRNWSSKSDGYEWDGTSSWKMEDLPESDHMFVKDDDSTMMGTGKGVDSTNRQDFTDSRDRLPTDKETFGPDPRGPHNMWKPWGDNKKRRSLYDKTRERVKGAYHGRV